MTSVYVPDAKNYTLGKGKMLLKLLGETAFRDLGNLADFKINVESNKIEHFSSRSGLKVKDADIVDQQKATISFTAEELTPENLQLFLMSSAPSPIAQSSSSVTDQVVAAAHNKWVALGKNKLSSVVVTNSAADTTYVLGTDYVMDLEEGLFMALSTGSITDAQSLKIDYAHAAETRNRISAATKTSIEGDIIFVGDPPRGRKWTVKGYGVIYPAGELPLIGDEIVKAQFNGEFLKNSAYTGLVDFFDRGQVAI